MSRRFYTLPPVGRPVDINCKYILPPIFNGYLDCWLSSGTAALAKAIQLSCARLKKNGVVEPEIILPAYGCPDLVAAAIYAGAKPVLVDVESDVPGYKLDCLQESLNEKVAAVVAVNFLGIAENLTQIRVLITEKSNALLIEDNAQWYPQAEGMNSGLTGDLALTSFGRGKPVNLLGGGILWIKKTLFSELKEENLLTCTSAELSQWDPQKPGLKPKVKAALFNRVLRPRIYFWMSRLPFLHVGETRYHPLENIEPLAPEVQFIAGENIRKYLSSDSGTQKIYNDFFEKINSSISPLPLKCASRTGKLLRYPVLMPQAVSELDESRRQVLADLGVSTFYQKPLIDIDGIASMVVSTSDYGGARAFAERLLTLPMSPFIKSEDIALVLQEISAQN